MYANRLIFTLTIKTVGNALLRLYNVGLFSRPVCRVWRSIKPFLLH